MTPRLLPRHVEAEQRLLLGAPRTSRTVRVGAAVRLLYLPYLAAVFAGNFLGAHPWFRWSVQAPIVVVFAGVVVSYAVLRRRELRAFRGAATAAAGSGRPRPGTAR